MEHPTGKLCFFLPTGSDLSQPVHEVDGLNTRDKSYMRGKIIVIKNIITNYEGLGMIRYTSNKPTVSFS